MAGKPFIIEKLGLSEVVQRLVAEGVTTRAAVAEVLRSQYDADVSDATVGRYLAKIKSSATSKAFQIISDHVDRVVPEDLNALERMEALAYSWAMEASIPQAKRLAAAAAKIADNLDYWKSLILSDLDCPAVKIQEIIAACLSYVQEDAREQEQRLKAMRQAVKIIDLKLSKAGLLDDDTKGRIVILSRAEAKPEAETSPRPKFKLLHMQKPGGAP